MTQKDFVKRVRSYLEDALPHARITLKCKYSDKKFIGWNHTVCFNVVYSDMIIERWYRMSVSGKVFRYDTGIRDIYGDAIDV